jgi:hypothetical protein
MPGWSRSRLTLQKFSMDGLRRPAAKRRLAAASGAALIVTVGLIAALGIIFVHSNGANPSELLGALINLQPAPAESFAAPINYAQNKPLVTGLTSDLVTCFGAAGSVDEGAK